MQPVPFLRLPYLALKEFLKCLNPMELFTLSQCSTKTYQKIKSIKLVGTRDFRLSVDPGNVSINKEYMISILKNDPEKAINSKNFRSFGSNDQKVTVPVDMIYDDELTSFWDDTSVGLKTVCNHLFDIFGCKLEEFHPYINFEEIKKPLIEEILKLSGGEIQKLIVRTREINDDNLKWILDAAKVNKELKIFCKVSKNFMHTFKTHPKFFTIDTHYVYDEFTSWITLDNLLSFDTCVTISLRGSKMTNQDLNVFMKLWKSGKYPKLQYLRVDGNNLNVNEPIDILGGMKKTACSEIKSKIINDLQYRIYEGIDIQRDDGVMATFQFSARWGEPSFLLIVWID